MSQDYNVVGIVRLRMAAGKTGQLSVPSKMMANLEVGAYFRPEWTDEGILYRFMGTTLVDAQNVPGWARTNGQS